MPPSGEPRYRPLRRLRRESGGRYQSAFRRGGVGHRRRLLGRFVFRFPRAIPELLFQSRRPSCSFTIARSDCLIRHAR